MPIIKSVISSVPQWWIVCALCTSALANMAFRVSCFYEVVDILDLVTAQSKVVTEFRETSNSDCPYLYSTKSIERKRIPFTLPNIYWSSEFAVMAGTAHFMGMVLSTLPAGVLSILIYPKYVLIASILLTVFSNMVYATLKEVGTMFIVVNVAEGIGDGCFYPSVIGLISRWVPPSNRNTFMAIVLSGSYIGRVLGHVIFKYIYTSWSSGYYKMAIVGLILAALCSVLVFNSPEESPFISQRECSTITCGDGTSSLNRMQILFGIPWVKILTSTSLFYLILALCGLELIGENIMDNFRNYQVLILHLPRIRRNDVMMFSASFCACLIGGVFADFIVRHNLISKTIMNRVYVFVSVFCPFFMMVAVYLVGCNALVYWILIVTAAYSGCLAYPVLYSNLVVISPQYSGLLMGIAVFVQRLFYYLDDQISKVLIHGSNRNVYILRFIISTIKSLILVIPFLFFWSGETQLCNRASVEVTRTPSQARVELETFGKPDTR